VLPRTFIPVPPPGTVTIDVDAGRIVGRLRTDPNGWTVVSEVGARFNDIDWVASAQDDVRAVSVSYFHHGLFEFAAHGQLRQVSQTAPVQNE
jgi:hypothetical protein